jgi:hypothetical protein
VRRRLRQWIIASCVLACALLWAGASSAATSAYQEGGASTGAGAFTGTCDNTGNAQTSNNQRALCDNGELVVGSEFGLQGLVPTTATDIRLTVSVEGLVSNADNVDLFNTELSWDGGTGWTSPVTPTGEIGAGDTSSFAPTPQACSAFGRTWARAELTDANFRVRVTAAPVPASQTMSVDDIDVRVCYANFATLAAEIAGGASVAASPSASVPVAVQVEHTNVADSGPDWRSTQYQIEGQSAV